MKLIRTILALLLVAFLVIFIMENMAFQKLEFLGYQVNLPISIMAISFYVLGTISGVLIFRILKKGLNRNNED